MLLYLIYYISIAYNHSYKFKTIIQLLSKLVYSIGNTENISEVTSPQLLVLIPDIKELLWLKNKHKTFFSLKTEL